MGARFWCVEAAAACTQIVIMSESTPMNLDWHFNVRMNASFDRACMCCIFEALLVLWGGCPGDSNGDRQPIDLSGSGGAHLFVNRCSRTREVKSQCSCHDAHRGENARAERGRDEVGRRETLSTALIIDGRICSQLSF
jgi:hypothetical protein